MSRKERGTVLVAVLLVVMLSAMIAAGLMYRVRAEGATSAAADRGEQAYQAALSGLQATLFALKNDGGDPTPLFDNPDLFANQLVYDDGANKWYFSVYAAPDPSTQGTSSGLSGSGSGASIRYGVTDLNGMVNLNFADSTTLQGLPNITPDMSDALIAYRSAPAAQPGGTGAGGPGTSNDSSAESNTSVAAQVQPSNSPFPDLAGSTSDGSSTQPSGVSTPQPATAPASPSASSNPQTSNGQDYYDQLPQPYVIPGGPLSSVDELLMVKGFTAQIVYGEDANFNGTLEPNEDDGDQSFPPDNADGQLDRGLMGLVNVYSYDRNVDSQGHPRIDLNKAPLSDLAAAGLPSQTISFIAQFRNDGNIYQTPSQLYQQVYTPKSAATQPAASTTQPAAGTTPGNSPGNSTGTASGNTSSQTNSGTTPVAAATTAPSAQQITSGVTADLLPLVLDKLTTTAPGDRQYGLININTAPAAVLTCLPGIDPGIAQQIVGVRGNLTPQAKATTAWLVSQNLVDDGTYKRIAPKLTTRSLQFHVRCLGFGWPCGRFRMIEAVVDMASGTPAILYLRDTTKLGLPFALDAEQLNNGTPGPSGVSVGGSRGGAH